MYKWVLVLMRYINEMVGWELKALRTERMKFLLYIAAGIGERKGTENLENPEKESGEDYARRILEFLGTGREEKLRKKKEEDKGTKWNVSAGVFYIARDKEETEKNEGRKEGEQMKLYPQSGVMIIHSD